MAMLRHLHIQNYALIEDIDIEAGRGLTTITGETGAGKSIILGAIGLLAGNRADRSMLKNDRRKCIIEAHFDLKGRGLEELFTSNDLDYAEDTVIRREFSLDGKSRVFINDSPAALLHLRSIMNNLLDVHSQHENLELNNRKYQLHALDLISGNQELLSRYGNSYKLYRASESHLEQCRQKSVRMRENADYVASCIDELSSAGLSSGEAEELEAEQKMLDHASETMESLSAIDRILDNSEQDPISMLAKLTALLKRTSENLPALSEVLARLEIVSTEAEDIRRDLLKIISAFTFDPARHEVVQDRLSLIYRLQQKYRLPDVDSLIKREAEFRGELEAIENTDEEVQAAEADFRMKKEECLKLAAELTRKRSQGAELMESHVQSVLKALGMVNSRFEIEIQKLGEEGPDGSESAEFLFSANKGHEVRALGKVASGGELSRLMLAVKSVLTSRTELPTIIFDEIDSGISGTVADRMGDIISKMSRSTQVIVITHLPQIAARGHQHLAVYKDEEGRSSKTEIRELRGEERTREIARLLSGKEISREAMDNARVLLGAGN